MRKGGPGLSHASSSEHCSAHAAPAAVDAVSDTASDTGSGAVPDVGVQAARASGATPAIASANLADIGCAIGIYHRASHARRCFEGAEGGDGGDFLRGGDAAEGDV